MTQKLSFLKSLFFQIEVEYVYRGSNIECEISIDNYYYISH